MKIYFLLVFLFLSFPTAGCFSQGQKNVTTETKIINPYFFGSEQTKDKPVPDAQEAKQAEENTWDFGQVKEGEVLKHEFILKNDLRITMNITRVDTSCGCTASKVKKKVLAPGESTTLEVNFNSKGRSGPTQQFVYVQTDNLDKPVIRFKIKADVK
jgi:uncharacterized cupredoxin-like copper-binding protein